MQKKTLYRWKLGVFVALQTGLFYACVFYPEQKFPSSNISKPFYDGMAREAVKPEQGQNGELWIRLLKLRDRLYQVAERCGDSASKAACDTGDATLFNGILCASGDTLSCKAVSLSQGGNGRFWRSPLRVGFELENAFSRDMALGVLLYFVKTHDTYAAVKWMRWLQEQNFRFCPAAADNRCSFTPGLWNLFAKVWNYLDLPLNQKMQDDVVDSEFLLLFSAHITESGYPLHLTAVTLLLHKLLGIENEFTRLAGAVLHGRQKENLFFLWLHGGTNENLQERVLKSCSPSNVLRGNKSQWSFERSDSSGAILNSMGWECIALINFMANDLATVAP